MAGSIRIAVKTTNDGSGFKEAANDADEFGRRVTQASAVATAGLVGLGAAVLKTAADYEQSLSQLQAVSGATAAEMEQLAAKAKSIGAETAFGTSEGVAGMEELAASGLKVTDILNGGADAAVALAAAGGTSLPNAARIAATAMSAWALEGKDVIDVSNRLAAAANVSRFGVEDMGQAFGSVAATAAAMNVGLDETSAAIASLADATASGGDAGTSLKSFLLALPGNSKEAKDAIAELGLQFFDAEGSMRSLSEIISELNTKMDGLDQKSKLELVNKIFGSDGGRAALDLMKMTGAEFTALMDTMGNTSAADVAAVRLDNAKGSIDALKGSAETLAIALGEKAIPVLAGAAEMATQAVNGFAGLPESTQGLALGFGAMAVAAPAAVAGIGNVAEGLKAMKTALSGGDAALSGMARVGTLLPGIAVGLGAVAVAADVILQKKTGYGLMDHLFGDVNKMEAYAEASDKIADALYGITDPAEQNTRIIAGLTTAMATWVDEEEALAQVNATDKLYDKNAALQELGKTYKQQEEAVRATFAALAENNASIGQMANLYRALPPEMQKVADEVANVTGKQEAYTAAMADSQSAFYAAQEAANDTAAANQGLGKSTEFVRDSIPQAKDALQLFNEGLEEGDDRAQKLAERLGILGGRFEALNPQFAKNNIELATLKEELQDLKAAGDSYSESLGMTTSQIEARIKVLDGENESLSTNRQAYEDLASAMSMLEGPAGMVSGSILKIDEGIKKANLSHEQQIEVAGRAGAALSELADKDIPGAAKALLDLGKTAPDAMKAFIDGIADPKVKADIIAALTSQAADAGAAMYTAWYGAAGLALKGYTEGLAASQNAFYAAAEEAAGEANAGMSHGLGNKSPSTIWRAAAHMAAEGFILGLRDREDDVALAARRTADRANMTLESYSVRMGVATGGPYTHSAAGNRPTRTGVGSYGDDMILDGRPVGSDSMGGGGSYGSDMILDGQPVGGNGNGYSFKGSGGSGVGYGTPSRPKPKAPPAGPNNMLPGDIAKLATKIFNMTRADRDAYWAANPGMKEYFRGQGYWINSVGQMGKSDGGGPLSNDGWSQENTEALAGNWFENHMEQLLAAIGESPNQGLDPFRASAFEDPFVAKKFGTPVFNSNGPPQHLIDMGLDEFGVPAWAKAGWAGDPQTGWTYTGQSQMSGANWMQEYQLKNAQRAAGYGMQWGAPMEGGSLPANTNIATLPRSSGGGSFGGSSGGRRSGGEQYSITIQAWDSQSLQQFVPRLIQEIREYERRTPGARP